MKQSHKRIWTTGNVLKAIANSYVIHKLLCNAKSITQLFSPSLVARNKDNASHEVLV